MSIQQELTAAVDPGGTERAVLTRNIPSGTQKTAPATGALTDKSGTITSGGASQVLAAANTSRKYFFVLNLSAENLWINFTTAAAATQPSIKLIPGSSFVMEDSFISTEAINILGATTASPFCAKEG